MAHACLARRAHQCAVAEFHTQERTVALADNVFHLADLLYEIHQSSKGTPTLKIWKLLPSFTTGTETVFVLGSLDGGGILSFVLLWLYAPGFYVSPLF